MPCCHVTRSPSHRRSACVSRDIAAKSENHPLSLSYLAQRPSSGMSAADTSRDTANTNDYPPTQPVTPPDVFIVVRPPPSSSTNPLNLQIQLCAPVKPYQRSRAGSNASARAYLSSSEPQLAPAQSSRRSSSPELNAGSSASTLGAVAEAQVGRGSTPAPSRSPSMRSDRSFMSSASSTGSPNSNVTSRRTIPMYNLEFHSLMSTVITDAGTDAKVAKFLKKGGSIEILHLAVIEAMAKGPYNTPRGSSTTLGDAGLSPKRASVALPQNHSSENPRESQLPSSLSSPLSSNFSPSSPNPQPANSAKSGGNLNIIGKFKRWSSLVNPASKGISSPTLPEALNNSNLKRTSTQEEASERSSVKSGRNTGENAFPLFRIDSRGEEVAANRRAHGYIWVVRRWERTGLEGTEFAIEWTKDRSSLGSKNSSKRKEAVAPSPNRSIPDNIVHPQEADLLVPSDETTEDPNRLVPGRRKPRSRKISDRSTSLVPPSTVEEDHDGKRESLETEMCGRRSGDTEIGPDILDDEESDPEDSETPWHCELIVGKRKRHQLAVFTPAPHHPRLVGQLVMPGDLTTISVIDTPEGLVSAEECKDIVASTALWLMVRESLGGVGSRRKA